MKEKLLVFLSDRSYCVLSTVNTHNKPESAFVAFSNNGLELIIGTSSQSRKYQNILQNPSVAIVVADETGEVQYGGEATILAGQTATSAENQYTAQIPGSDKYRQDPTQVYIQIRPTWVRFIQHGEPDIIEEFTEF